MSCSDTNTSLGGSYCSTTRGSGSSTNFGNSSSSQGVVTVSPGVGSGGNTTCERELFIELFVVEAVETRGAHLDTRCVESFRPESTCTQTSRDNKGSLFRASHSSTVIHPEPQLMREQLDTCRVYFSCCGTRSSSSGSGSGTGSTSNTGSGSGTSSGTGGNTGGTTGTTGGGYGSSSSTTTVQHPSPSTTAVSSGTDRS
ncbi:hypothetical protein NEUTE2DRAFT_135581 [Neurospora tetrasperma FGSC 2509]|nr:hypothetical protein NEUTE2DRAFT_135581 [Neurospora tetrasperma FGSC 2509]